MKHSAKDIVLKPISGPTARSFVKKHHYSGKVALNSKIHIGVYLKGALGGVMQFGPPLDKRRMLTLVPGTPWEGMVELNRMAFSDRLPPNSESRALGVMSRIFKQHAPQIKWVVSFADGTQCGDGTIYRAAGFDLTAIKPSDNLARFPDGSVSHKMKFESTPTMPRPEAKGKSYYDVTGGRYNWKLFLEVTGGVIIPGYQLRYIKFIDPTYREKLAVPILPYSKIQDMGASMYLGQKR